VDGVSEVLPWTIIGVINGLTHAARMENLAVMSECL
jgi:hypothetical protein